MLSVTQLLGPAPVPRPMRMMEHHRRAHRFIEEMLNDIWFQNEMHVTLQMIANALDTVPIYIRVFQRGKQIALPLVEKIRRLEDDIKNRAIILTADHGVVYLIPPDIAPLGPKIVFRNEDKFNLHMRCNACYDNRYLPAILHDDYCAICYNCLPPSQYPAIGATLQDGSLLLAELDKLGILADIEEVRPKPPPPPPVKKRPVVLRRKRPVKGTA